MPYELIDLGTLGGTQSEGYSINNLGHIAGSSTIPGDGWNHAFFWDGTMQDLGTLGGIASVAYGINELDHVVGQSRVDESSLVSAFFWDGVAMTDQNWPYTFGRSYAINEADETAGYGSNGGYPNIGIFYDGVVTDIGQLTPTPQYTTAYDVNDSGVVVGYSDSANVGTTNRAFRWESPGPMIDLGTLRGLSYSESYATGINNAGHIVGHSDSSRGYYSLFLYIDGIMTELPVPTPEATNIYATAINELDHICGYYETPYTYQAFFWDGEAFTDIVNDFGGDNSFAFDINDHDLVTGSAENQDSNRHAYIWGRLPQYPAGEGTELGRRRRKAVLEALPHQLKAGEGEFESRKR